MNRGKNRDPDRDRHLVLEIDDYDVNEFSMRCLSGLDNDCGYVVTPNADHLIRYVEDKDFQGLYAEARYVLLDSRFLAHLVRVTTGQAFKVCPGSDLTASLLASLRGSGEPLVLIGATEQQAEKLRGDYLLANLHHYNPPMGFIGDEPEVRKCIDFIVAAGAFRFCFLAVGSPQQEVLARRLARENLAAGLVLCIGASINFLTGIERRAPGWMRRCGMEWLFRLARNPRRLFYRYLVRGPRVFAYLRRVKLVRRQDR